MPLADVSLVVGRSAPPRQVQRFLREAGRRIDRYRQHSRLHGFVPSDYLRAYAMLRALAAAELAPGNLFCEWGSGFGVVACLAALLGFEACGIEVEAELVDSARQLAEDFDLEVQFVCGSFIPHGGARCLRRADGYAWLDTEASSGHAELGLDPDDFDVIFAYPWPDEEAVTGRLFDRFAADNAILVSYHGADDFRVRRRVAGKRGR